MNRVSDVLNRVCELTLMLFLSAMTVAVFLEILFRYLFHFPLFWTEEFARYCLVWSSLLGASIALKRGEHIAVTLFLNRFPPPARHVMMLVAEISVAAILAVILWGGISLVMVTSRQLSPALRISMALPYSALPVAASVMLVHVVDHLVRFKRLAGECAG
jgi:TRAP-type C4-dicarboxylate transport system permease small subunit